MIDSLKYWLGSVVHNCIAHPLMPFLPKKWGTAFHDWTIERCWPPRRGDPDYFKALDESW